jgi:hypothetical protein
VESGSPAPFTIPSWIALRSIQATSLIPLTLALSHPGEGIFGRSLVPRLYLSTENSSHVSGSFANFFFVTKMSPEIYRFVMTFGCYSRYCPLSLSASCRRPYNTGGTRSEASRENFLTGYFAGRSNGSARKEGML